MIFFIHKITDLTIGYEYDFMMGRANLLFSWGTLNISLYHRYERIPFSVIDLLNDEFIRLD